MQQVNHGNDGHDSDKDLEEQLERELAALGNEGGEGSEALWRSEEGLLLPAPFVHGALTDSDDEDKHSTGSKDAHGREEEEEEPASLAAFRAALQKRDASLVQFEGELQQATDVARQVRPGSVGAAGGAEGQQGQGGEQQQQQQEALHADVARQAVRPESVGPTAGGAAAEGLGGEQQQQQQQQEGDAAASVSGQPTQQQQEGSKGEVAAAQGGDQPTQHHHHHHQQQSDEAGMRGEGGAVPEGPASERQAFLAELRAQEIARTRVRKEQVAAAEAARRREQEQAEENARKAEEALATQREAALAALEAQQAALVQEAASREEHRKAEALRMEEEKRRVEKQLDEQAAAAAEREAHAQALQDQLNQELAVHARERNAARRIERAWLSYCAAPEGRPFRLSQIAVLQCAWRARTAHAEYSHLRAQRAAMQRVESAVSAAAAEDLQKALADADGLGIGEAARARVEAFQRGATDVEQRLAAAASTGNAVSFRGAVEAAHRFAHLKPRVDAAVSAFHARCQTAEAALHAAIADSPMQGVMAALDAASQLGLDAALLSSALASARARDARMAQQLQALAAAPIVSAAHTQLAAAQRAKKAQLHEQQQQQQQQKIQRQKNQYGVSEGGSGSEEEREEFFEDELVDDQHKDMQLGDSQPQQQQQQQQQEQQQCYDASAFAALSARAMSLGLRGDVAAAKGILDQRRRLLVLKQRQAMQALQQQQQPETVENQNEGEPEGDALGVTALAEEARVLGLDNEADALMARLKARQQSITERLHAAAEFGTPAGLHMLLAVADSWGISADVQQAAHRKMDARRARTVSELDQAARTGSLAAFKRCRHDALVCGAHNEVDVAQTFLQQRRQHAAHALAAACTALLSTPSTPAANPQAPSSSTSSSLPTGSSAKPVGGMQLTPEKGGGQPHFVLHPPAPPPPPHNYSSDTAGFPHHSSSAYQHSTDVHSSNHQSNQAIINGHDSSSYSSTHSHMQRVLRFVCAASTAAGLGSTSGNPCEDVVRQVRQPESSASDSRAANASARAANNGSRVCRLAAAAAEALPPQPPAQVLAALGEGGDAHTLLQQGGAALWCALREVLILGLEPHARLALGGVHLHCQVHLAEGTRCLACQHVQHDYWGQPLLPDWPLALSPSSSDIKIASPPNAHHPGHDGVAAVAAAQIARSAAAAECGDGRAGTGLGQPHGLGDTAPSPASTAAVASAATAANAGSDLAARLLGVPTASTQRQPWYPASAVRLWPQPPPRPLLLAHAARCVGLVPDQDEGKPDLAMGQQSDRDSAHLHHHHHQDQQRQQQLRESLVTSRQVSQLREQLLHQQAAAWACAAQQAGGQRTNSSNQHNHHHSTSACKHGGVVLDLDTLSAIAAAQPPVNSGHSEVQSVGARVSESSECSQAGGKEEGGGAKGEAGRGEASGTGSGSVETTRKALSSTQRLDLRLERLASVGALDVWCPDLRVLLASGNKLSSWAGIAGLSRLQELKLSDNCMAGASVEDMQGVQACLPSLRVLHLDANGLEQLSCLAPLVLSQLHTLNLASNQLHSLLLPPSAQSSSSTSTKHGNGMSSGASEIVGGCEQATACVSQLHGLCPLACCAQSLTVLDLSHNRLTSLAGLAACPSLTSLDAAHNDLQDGGLVGGALEGCHHLRRLRLSHNRLCAWPADALAAMPLLQHLDLSDNTIQHLYSNADSLEGGGAARALLLPPSLQVLLLRDNQITHMGPLQGAPMLEKVDLSFNQIFDPVDLRALSTAGESLSLLQAHDNPVCQHPDYATSIHASLPFLSELDGQPISECERAQHVARACCTSPLLVLAARRMMTEKCLPSDIHISMQLASLIEPSLEQQQAAAPPTLPPPPTTTTAAAAPPPAHPAAQPEASSTRPPGTHTRTHAHALTSSACRLLRSASRRVPAQLLPAVSSDPVAPSAHDSVAQLLPQTGGTAASSVRARNSGGGGGGGGGGANHTAQAHPGDAHVAAHIGVTNSGRGRGDGGAGSWAWSAVVGLLNTHAWVWDVAGRLQSRVMGSRGATGGVVTEAVPPAVEPSFLPGASVREMHNERERQQGPGADGSSTNSTTTNNSTNNNNNVAAAHSTHSTQSTRTLWPWASPEEAHTLTQCAADEPCLAPMRPFLFPFTPGTTPQQQCSFESSWAGGAAGGYGYGGGGWAVEGDEVAANHNHMHSSLTTAATTSSRTRPAITFAHAPFFGSSSATTNSHGYTNHNSTNNHSSKNTNSKSVVDGSVAESERSDSDAAFMRSLMGVQQRQQAELACTVAGSGDESDGPWGELIVRFSYAERLQQHRHRAASRIQAAWRGLKARRHAQDLRSEAHQQLRSASAVTIQRVWRGHVVRAGPDLAALLGERAARKRAEALAREQAEQVAAEARRADVEAAVLHLQACIRARAVRKRLQAAVQAARYVDSDDDEEYAGVDEGFLDDVADLLGEEKGQIPTSFPPLAPPPAPQLPNTSTPHTHHHNHHHHHHNHQHQQQQQHDLDDTVPHSYWRPPPPILVPSAASASPPHQRHQQGPPTTTTHETTTHASSTAHQPAAGADKTNTSGGDGGAGAGDSGTGGTAAGGGMAAAVAAKMAQFSHLTRAFAAKTGRAAFGLGGASAGTGTGQGAAGTNGGAGAAAAAASAVGAGSASAFAGAGVPGAHSPAPPLQPPPQPHANGPVPLDAMPAWEGHVPLARAPPQGTPTPHTRIPSLPPLKRPPSATTPSHPNTQPTALPPSHLQPTAPDLGSPSPYPHYPHPHPYPDTAYAGGDAGYTGTDAAYTRGDPAHAYARGGAAYAHGDAAYVGSGASGGGSRWGSEASQSVQLSDEEGSGSDELVSPASQAPSSVAALDRRQSKHKEKLAALMKEWGFKDEATAEAFLRRQQRVTQGATRAKREARFKDPRRRLRKLQDQVDQRPKLRAEDMAPPPTHGPPLPLHHGSLRGPPSRETQQNQQNAQQNAQQKVGHHDHNQPSPHATPRTSLPPNPLLHHPHTHAHAHAHAARSGTHPHPHTKLGASPAPLLPHPLHPSRSPPHGPRSHTTATKPPHPNPASLSQRPPSAGPTATSQDSMGIVGARIGGQGGVLLPALPSLPSMGGMSGAQGGGVHAQATAAAGAHRRPSSLPERVQGVSAQKVGPGGAVPSSGSLQHRASSKERDDDEASLHSVHSAASAPEALDRGAPARNGRTLLPQLAHPSTSSTNTRHPLLPQHVPQSNNWVGGATPTQSVLQQRQQQQAVGAGVLGLHSSVLQQQQQQQQQQQAALQAGHLQQQAAGPGLLGLHRGGSGGSSSGGSAAKLLLEQRRSGAQAW